MNNALHTSFGKPRLGAVIVLPRLIFLVQGLIPFTISGPPFMFLSSRTG
jgi:hypothetical protein